MIRLTVFIILSICLVIWSWKSLWNRQVHGFYRFFTFESILALILINVKSWFTNPFSVAQIISWILLLGSIVMAIQGFYLLHTIGRPTQGIEATTILVKTGVYKYIRHPLYSSLILLGWGAFLKEMSFLPAILAILATTFAIATARVEEKENLQRFGDEYASYMKSTKRFLPFLV
ncbi:methyltransferase family protein [Chloroflexota bacterium]